MSNCPPLEVVGRGSDTQLQVVEKINQIKSGKGLKAALLYNYFMNLYLWTSFERNFLKVFEKYTAEILPKTTWLSYW